MFDLIPNTGATRYEDIFRLRGSLYHQAMELYPDARADEFHSVINQAHITPGVTVVDVPSGGGYISRYLDDVNLIGLEVTPVFAQLAAARQQNVVLYGDDHYPLRDAAVDRVLSIAGLHHVRNKVPVFSEMCRIVKPSGRAVIADVAEDSAVRRFLDEFVDRYSETGHSGWYFNDHTRSELRAAGFCLQEDRLLNYRWSAPDIDQLADFCRLLFGLVRADVGTVAAGIRDYLDIRSVDGRVGMQWQLRSFSCTVVPGQAR